MALLLGLGNDSVHADANLNDEQRAQRRPAASLSSLIRTYVVYSACSFPSVVDFAPTVLNALMSVPGVKQITEAAVRATFFSQVRIHASDEDTRINANTLA
jgi:proline dehydrogenase